MSEAPPMDDRRAYRAWAKAQRDLANDDTAIDFLRTLARLEADGLKGSFANLGRGITLEQSRQIARKKGWAHWPGKGGQGWLLTDQGRTALEKSKETT